MVKSEVSVETVIAFDNNSVSSPIFSDWISGRLPIGMAAIRQNPSMVIFSALIAFRIKNIAIGSAIIRINIYPQIRISLKPLVTFDLAIETPSRLIDRNTVAFPI